MILLIILLILAILFVQYIIAKKFEEIAFAKGYDESIHSFAMCFWLGVVGYLYVIALPQNPKKRNKSEETEKLIEKEAQPTIGESDLYECDSFVITERQSAGHCFACGELHDALRCCKIRKGVDIRDAFVCKKCIHLFMENGRG